VEAAHSPYTGSGWTGSDRIRAYGGVRRRFRGRSVAEHPHHPQFDLLPRRFRHRLGGRLAYLCPAPEPLLRPGRITSERVPFFIQNHQPRHVASELQYHRDHSDTHDLARRPRIPRPAAR
jgi:hypothetical protein